MSDTWPGTEVKQEDWPGTAVPNEPAPAQTANEPTDYGPVVNAARGLARGGARDIVGLNRIIHWPYRSQTLEDFANNKNVGWTEGAARSVGEAAPFMMFGPEGVVGRTMMGAASGAVAAQDPGRGAQYGAAMGALTSVLGGPLASHMVAHIGMPVILSAIGYGVTHNEWGLLAGALHRVGMGNRVAEIIQRVANSGLGRSIASQTAAKMGAGDPADAPSAPAPPISRPDPPPSPKSYYQSTARGDKG